jgi:CubicO group peptidase (beta-lactamase class C family)
MTSLTRRDVLSTLLSASIRGILPASLQETSRATSPTAGIQRHDFEPVRDRIREAIASRAATGVAVAVAHGGRIIWEEGFGWANREAAVKATARTPFSLASITKPFTATMLMTLVAEGNSHWTIPRINTWRIAR